MLQEGVKRRTNLVAATYTTFQNSGRYLNLIAATKVRTSSLPRTKSMNPSTGVILLCCMDSNLESNLQVGSSGR